MRDVGEEGLAIAGEPGSRLQALGETRPPASNTRGGGLAERRLRSPA